MQDGGRSPMKATRQAWLHYLKQRMRTDERTRRWLVMRSGKMLKRGGARERGPESREPTGRRGCPVFEAFPACCALVLLVSLKPRLAWVYGRSKGLKENFCSEL